MWPKVFLHEPADWNARNVEDEQQLSLEWHPEALVYPHLKCSESWCNHTTSADFMVTIKLAGYEETVSEDGTRTVRGVELLEMLLKSPNIVMS